MTLLMDLDHHQHYHGITVQIADSWYGVPLYSSLQIVLVTAFYLLLLLLPINLTSATMTCFNVINVQPACDHIIST